MYANHTSTLGEVESRESVSDRLLAQDKNRLKKDVIEVTMLQPNNTTIKLHKTTCINKIEEQETTSIALRLIVRAPTNLLA